MSRAPLLRRLPRRDQRVCRLGVEPLEDRRMLNVAPVAVDDLYSTGLETTFAINATEPEFADSIYESTQQGPSDQGGGSNIDASQFLASRFFVDATVRTGRIGAQIAGNAAVGNGMLFAAVVALSGQDDFPDSVDLSTPDVLGHSLLTIEAADFNGHLIAAPLDVELAAGWYAIVYGSGRFGATGSGSAPGSGIGGHEQLHTSNGAAWTSQTDRTSHFFLDGQATPIGVLANDSDAESDPLTASLVDDVQHGTLDLNADGSFTYTPESGYIGIDTFTYRANDGELNSDLATATINVVDVNLPPTASDDAYSIDEDGVLDVGAALGVLANDQDANGDVLSATPIRDPDHGTLQLNLDGSFVYTPNENFFGTDTFTYRASDGELDSAVPTVTITVDAVDDPPVAVDELYSTEINTALAIDSAIEPLYPHRIYESTQHGSSDQGGGASISDTQFIGSRFFVGATARTGRIGGQIAGDRTVGNGAIFAAVVALSGPNDFPDSVDLSTADVLGHTLLTIEAPDFNGHLIAAPLDVELTPGWYAVVYGTGRFGATGSGSAPGSGIGSNVLLSTTNGAAWTSQTGHHAHFFLDGEAIPPGVLANDSDVEGDPLTAALVQDVEHGALNLNADGTFTYTPNLDFVGTDTFTYRANDGALDSNLATVTLNVVDLNLPPTAGDDSYSIDEDGVLNVHMAAGVLDNDVDANDHALSATRQSGPDHGTLQLNPDGSFIYTPDANFFGEDSFTYVANDGELDSNLATVSITVLGLAPETIGEQYPAIEDELLDIDAARGVLANDTDHQGDEITAVLLSDVSNGTLTLRPDGSFTYTPNANYVGPDSFRYRASDGQHESASTLVQITVQNVNDPPVAVDDGFEMNEGQTLIPPSSVGRYEDIIRADDPSGYWRFSENASASVAADSSGNDKHGTYRGDVVLEQPDAISNPNPGAVKFDRGPDHITLPHDLVDGATNLTAEFWFQSESTGKQAIISGALNSSRRDNEYLIEFPTDTSLVYVNRSIASVSWTIPSISDGQWHHYVIVRNDASDVVELFIDGQSHGQRSIQLSAVSLSPGGLVIGEDQDYTGTIGTGFDPEQALDGLLDELAFYPRVLTANEIQQHFLAAQSGGVLDNDRDVESDVLEAILVDDVQGGTLAMADDGTFNYTPNIGFAGVDAFTYVASDGQSTSNVATVTIRVNGAPVVKDDGYDVVEDSLLTINAVTGVLANDVDPNDDAMTAVLVSGPTSGTLALADDGSFTYTPDADFFGNDSFTYVANDGENDSDIATVTITVKAIDDPPVAVDDRVQVAEDTTANGVQPYSDIVLASNPIGYWRLGESSGSVATDASGHNLHGTYVGDVGLGQSGSLVMDSDTGVLLSRNEDRVTLPREAVHGQTDLTIEAWLKTTSTGFQTILSGTRSPTFSNEIIAVLRSHTEVVFNDSNRNVTWHIPSIADGRWHQMVYLRDDVNDMVEFYLDGTSFGKQSISLGVLSIAQGGLVIGEEQDSVGGSFAFDQALDGVLDELAIYPHLLSAAEIENHYRFATEGGSILSNDFDADNDPLTAILVDDVENGTLELNSDGTFTYTPNPEFSGTDSFTYEIDDGTTTSNVATVAITVAPVNDPPVAVDDSYRVPTSGSLVVAADRGLLDNDSDVENDPLVAILVAGPAHGTLTPMDDGSFEYTPDASFDRSDSFTYRASDGQDLSDIATVTLTLDAPLVEAGDHVLRANTPGQTISIRVSGEHGVSGLNLFVQIGDGGPELVDLFLPAGTVGPRITAVDLKTGTIFAGTGDPQLDDPGNLPQVVGSTISLASDPSTVEADGTLATLTIDTTGLFGGEWDLLLSDVLPGLIGGPFETDFAGEPAIIENGRLRIVPAAVVDRHVFYNESVFDGRDAAANTADDAAIAPDKTALFPGETATFANYSSYAGGLTGVMLDVARLLVPEGLTAADFAFRSGRNNDPSTWQAVDAPASVTVRPGAGVIGSERITLVWPPGTIEGTWLEVTLKSNANTGLPADDVFYFGSAVGESGNKPTDALVNATDVIAVRDHPRGPLNQAPLDNRLDFNRDALVNATDLVLARDHTTGLFSALPLITPVGGAASPAAAGAAAPLAAAAAAGELPTIVVGEHTLAADTPNQHIEIFVSGGQPVSGVNLIAQVGDGGPELVTLGLPAGTDGPAITSADLKTGTIFAALDDPQFDSPSLPQMSFSSLGIASANATVSADGLLVTLTIDTTGIFSGSFPLLLADVLPQLTNGPFATDFAGTPAEITSGIITVESSQRADLTGNGTVDFQDLTILLANWNKPGATLAEGNLVNADTTSVDFQDLTALLAAWTGSGGAASPQAAVGRSRLAATQEASTSVDSNVSESAAPRQAAA